MINVLEVFYHDGTKERVNASFSAALWAEDRLAKQNMNLQTHRLRFLTLTAYKTLKDAGSMDKQLSEWIETVGNITLEEESGDEEAEDEGFSLFQV